MEIRFATAGDVSGILELMTRTGRQLRQGRQDLFREEPGKYGVSGILSLLDSSHTPVFVAEVEGRIEGCCLCRIRETREDPALRDRTELSVEDLWIREGELWESIGEELLSAVRSYASGRRCQGITLELWAFQQEALAFFRKQGMTPRKICLEDKL